MRILRVRRNGAEVGSVSPTQVVNVWNVPGKWVNVSLSDGGRLCLHSPTDRVTDAIDSALAGRPAYVEQVDDRCRAPGELLEGDHG